MMEVSQVIMNELIDKMGYIFTYIYTIEHYCLTKKGKTSTE